MKYENRFARSDRRLRAAYIAKNCAQSAYGYSHKPSGDEFWGGISFGALLVGLFLMLLI